MIFEIILGLAVGLTVVNGVLDAISRIHSNGFTNTYVIQKIDKERQVVIYKNIKTREIKEEPFNEFKLGMKIYK